MKLIRLFFRLLLRAVRAVRRMVSVTWRRAKGQFAPAPRPFVRVVRTIFVLSLLAWVASLGLRLGGLDQSQDVWTTNEVATASRGRLAAIATALDTVRDRLAADQAIRHFTTLRSTLELFALFRQRDSVYSAHLPDSALTVTASDGRRADHGSAVYSADGRLIAWYSSRSVTFGFDTLLTGESLLANRDRGIFLDDQPIYAYLIAIRKLVSHEGVLEGYVETKRLIATKESMGSGGAASYGDDRSIPRDAQDATFLGDIQDAAHREVQLHFGGVPGHSHSNAAWTRVDLFADQSDPASFVGSLDISTRVTSEEAPVLKVLNGMWRLGASLVLFACLVWLLFAIAEPAKAHGQEKASSKDERSATPRPKVTRLLLSLFATGVMVALRILIARLGGLTLLASAAYQDTADFSSSWGYGIAQNPFELFVTSVFAASAAVMLWIVWMPRERLVRDDSKRKDIPHLSRRDAGFLVLFMVAAVLGSQFLADGLSSTVESIIMNGTLRYMTVRQVLPAPGMLMMLVSLLGLGVAYLFVLSLLLTFALRAAIFLFSRRLSIIVRIVGGSILLASLMIAAVFVSDQLAFSEISLLYRSALAALAFAVSLSVITIDALSPDPIEGGPSFLYKLPRSSRSILFILAISTLIMSPLVASKQLVADKLAAERIVRENAEVSTSELAGGAARVLTVARDRLHDWSQSGRDTSALRESAFLIWLDGARGHPAWEASVTVTREENPVSAISHFATLGAASEMRRIGPVLDSASRLTSAHDSASGMTVRVIPCLTSSCAPVVAGTLHFNDTVGRATHGSAAPAGTALRVSVALWSDLPVLAKPASQFEVIASPALGAHGASFASSDPIAEGSFVIAEYRPNARRITNAPWLEVPSALPLWTVRALRHVRSFWQPTTFGGDHYQTLFYRLPANDAVITVSTPEPTFNRTLEFALRLNAIGLIYGAIVVLVVLLARQMAARRVRFTLRFRDRIFLIVLLISLVPLIVVTNVTRTLLSERAQSEEQDRLARDASVIKDRIARVLESPPVADVAMRSRDLQTEVESLSQIIGRDFSVFDASGRLRASSRPELYESSLLASTLSSRAVEEVALGERTFFTEPVQLGGETFEAGYQPVTAAAGSKLLAVLSLATMNEAARIDAEVARTTSFVYGIFAALGLVLLGIGALFAARVASPILQLIHATERVARGKLQTSIAVTRDDEIGELMQAFNEMTHELEKSREIVAQTERELAWKEMARQVAHEIKNPLTPMKLSVQHLEHAHEAKDPNFNSIFRRVIRTLREQIDVLTRIATEFSRFGAMPRRKWGPVNLRRVCESAVALFDAERSRIRFIIDVPKNLPLLHSDEDELRRAFVNLLRNAVQAIEGWGIVVIRATEAEGMLHVKVRDTGFGMSEETLKRAFDPNFSTKTSGMGLGLALVKKTITDMSGSIRVESDPGHGTAFFIDLPARGYIEEGE